MMCFDCDQLCGISYLGMKLVIDIIQRSPGTMNTKVTTLIAKHFLALILLTKGTYNDQKQSWTGITFKLRRSQYSMNEMR